MRKAWNSISEDVVRTRCDELGLIFQKTYIKNKKTHVVYLCPKHIEKGEISSAWTHIRTGLRGCPYCSGKYKTTSDFKNEIAQILPNVEVLGEYKTARTKISTRCLICGHTWSPEARSLQYGQGCPVCALKNKAVKRRKTQSEFELDLKKVSPNIRVSGNYLTCKDKIKCKCVIHNNEWESYPSNLLNGSAGCPMCALERFNNHPSKGERAIAEWLSKNEIQYESECSLDGCVYKRPLRFDFYLPNLNIAIEFDGEQHFHEIQSLKDSKERLLVTQTRDTIKNEYCLSHNIKLVRIPYTEYKHIDTILRNEIKEEVLPS